MSGGLPRDGGPLPGCAGECGNISPMFIDEIGAWGDAHFHEPAAHDAIESAEASLGHRLPDELRGLLTETNGIEGEFELGLLWTVERIAADNALFRTTIDFADLYMPFVGLVFFADGGNGDQFFLSLSGNNDVYVWDHENDSRRWVASTVLGYLKAWMRGQLTV